jgi:hypothetical protein
MIYRDSHNVVCEIWHDLQNKGLPTSASLTGIMATNGRTGRRLSGSDTGEWKNLKAAPSQTCLKL